MLREHGVNVNVEIRLMNLQGKECYRLTENRQNVGGNHGTDSYSWPSGRTTLSNTLILDL